MKTKASNLILFVFLVLSFVSRAQFAIGLRPSLSNFGGYDDRRRAELSVMTGTIGERSQLEFDFGWGHRQIETPTIVTLDDGQQTIQYQGEDKYWGSATALYQWHHKIFWRFYYYAGIGTSAFFSKNGLDILGLDVQIGFEIKLKIPLQLTFDYRPMLDVLDGMAYYHTVGLGVRYQFRKPEPEPEPKLFKRWKQKIFG